jgi:hypothetical protein
MYFDHQEFGGHYFRPMSAWSNLHALLGLEIQAGTYTFAPNLPEKDLRLFFAAPDGWGHYEREVTDRQEVIRIAVEHGTLPIERLRLQLLAEAATVDIELNARRFEAAEVSERIVAIAPSLAEPVTEVVVTARYTS